MNPLGGVQDEPSDEEFNPSKHFEIKPSLASGESPPQGNSKPSKKSGRAPPILNIDKGLTLMPSLVMSQTSKDAARINTMQVLDIPPPQLPGENDVVGTIRATPEILPVLESLQYEMMKFPSIDKKNSFREIIQGALEETIRQSPSQIDRPVSRSELMTLDHPTNQPKSSLLNVESQLDMSRSKFVSMPSGKSAINKSGFSLKSPSKSKNNAGFFKKILSKAVATLRDPDVRGAMYQQPWMRNRNYWSRRKSAGEILDATGADDSVIFDFKKGNSRKDRKESESKLSVKVQFLGEAEMAGGSKFGKRMESKRKTTQGKLDILNLIVSEILSIPEIREAIANRQTIEQLEFWRVKVKSTEGKPAEDSPFVKAQSKVIGSKQKRFSKDFLMLDVIKPAALEMSHAGSQMQEPPAKRVHFDIPNLTRNAVSAGPTADQPKRNMPGSGFQSVSMKGVFSDATSNNLSMRSQEALERLNAYVPIVLFLTMTMPTLSLFRKMIFYDTRLMPDMDGKKSPEAFLMSPAFISSLIMSIIRYNEHKVFDRLLIRLPDPEIFFQPIVLDALFSGEHSKLYIPKLIKKLKFGLKNPGDFTGNVTPLEASMAQQEEDAPLTKNTRILDPTSQTNKKPAGQLLQPQAAQEVLSFSHTNSDPKIGLSKDKILLIVSKYLDKLNDPLNCVDLLQNELDFSEKESFDLLIQTSDEDAVLELLRKKPDMKQHIEAHRIAEFCCYKVLLSFNSMDLINIFNLPTNPSKSSSASIYDAMCDYIKVGGDKIQNIVYIILYVNSTFWDFEKLWKLYQSLNEVLRYEGKNNWFAEIDNPLLFCIKVAEFFKRADKQLSITSKEIDRLCEDLVKFCLYYIKNSSQETLILEFFEKDEADMDFLGYAFGVKNLELFKIDFVSKTIHNMWNVGRSSKQKVIDFVHLAVFQKEFRRLSWSSLREDYSMPNEDNDIFETDFYLTSRSTLVKVSSEILWPLTYAIFEAVFSIETIAMYLGSEPETFKDALSWLKIYITDHPAFSTILIYLRVSFILSIIMKSLFVSSGSRSRSLLNDFYITQLSVFALQMFLYPIIFPDWFWFANNLQMLIVVLTIIYTYYLGLAIDSVGVILRIFARLVFVVIIFGVSSIFVMTVIAYPLQTAFLSFSQTDESGTQIEPELNMFRDMYRGVSVLFEYTFGSVVFVRPYVDQDFYTYALSFVLILFSFFGNIMMANMLVAFLANQFDEVTVNAQYYTLRMQYSLVKALSRPGIDSIFPIPYFFSIPAFPLVIAMLIKKEWRRPIDNFLKRISHGTNVILFSVMYHVGYLLFYVLYLYIVIFFRLLSQSVSSPSSLFESLVWIIVGPYMLIKLFFQDMRLLFSKLTNFKDTSDDDLFIITLTEEERIKYVEYFEKIYKVVTDILKDMKEKEQTTFTLSFNQLLYEIRRVFPQEFTPRGFEGSIDPEMMFSQMSMSEGMSSNLTAHKKNRGPIYNKNKFIFQKKFDLNFGYKLLRAVLSNFIGMSQEKTQSTAANLQAGGEIDLEFLANKLRKNMTPERVHILISFNKEELENAKKEFNYDEELMMRREIALINSGIAEISKQMAKAMELTGRFNLTGLLQSTIVREF